MHVPDAVTEFLQSLHAEGRSPKTIKWYRSVLGSFAGCHEAVSVEEINPSVLRKYIVNLRERETYKDAPQKPAQGRKMALQSVDGHVRALKAFWAWCSREYEFKNPMANIRPSPQRSPIVRAIAPEDFVRLFDATGDDLMGVRDRALLAFLADTGCRLGGLVNLKLEDLDIPAKRATVNEKGNKTRRVVYTAATARFLIAWLAVRSSLSSHVFTSSQPPYHALRDSGVEQLLRRLKHKAGVEGRVNPHSFRHRFAIAYVQNGGDLMSLAKLMGDDIKTVVDYYGIFTQDELAQLHEKFSPLKGMLS